MRRALFHAFVALLIVAPTSGAQQAAPCQAVPFREFDFWLGPWRVLDSTGTEVGRNHIERVLGGCVLAESWRGGDGSLGRSFNVYDQWARRWHQTWVDDKGLVLQLDGGLVEGRMVLEGTRTSPAGTPMRHRITWTPLPDRRVRQHWQRSADGGSTWVTVFDGMYEPVSP